MHGKRFVPCPRRLRCNGPMVSAFYSRSTSLGSSPGQGHCIEFLGKPIYSQYLSPFYPGIQMGTGKFNRELTHLCW